MQKFKSRGIVIGIFDLEIVGGGFGAERSTLFTFGRKILGEKKVTVTSLHATYPKEWAKDKLNDKPLVKEMKEFFDKVDIAIAHFGSKFDLPYIRAKLLEHGLKPVREPFFIDTWALSRYRLKLGNNKLETLLEFLKIPFKKTHFNVKYWRMAEHGNKKWANYIDKHCAIDVLGLECAVIKLDDIIWDMPCFRVVREGETKCPVKGCRGRLVGKGNRRSKTHEYHRYICLRCSNHFRTRGERWAF